MRLLSAYLLAVLPSSLRRLIGRRILGWDIHPSAYLGPSVIMVRHLSMGPGSSIGGRNVITNLEELRLGEGASIGSRNLIKGWWQSSDPLQQLPDRHPSVILGDYAMITAHHYIDCVDRLELGYHAALAGFRSTVLTHTLDLMRDRYVTGSVVVGDHAAVMSGCTLLAGTRVPPRSIVSAGSVVTTKLSHQLTLYRGNPAEAVRDLPERLAFFQRGEPRRDVEAKRPIAAAGDGASIPE